MYTIDLSPFDKKDILELLEYARQKKLEDKPIIKKLNKWDDSGYWDMRIDQLISIINGKQVHESYIQSSYETIDYDMDDYEKAQYRYEKRKEHEIEDLLGLKDKRW